MKKINTVIAIIIIISLFLLSGCKNLSSFSAGDSELKIGVEKIGSEFNPFYAEKETNNDIINQVFVPVLQTTSDNSLKNYCGGISYEYVGENQVKYTITIRDDLRFSNGDYVTIQDLIEFFYFISDATYKGTYSEWYLNDIAGLKEYYFDDKNYIDSINTIEEKIISDYTVATIGGDDLIEYLIATSIEGRYSGGVDSPSPSGESWRDYFVRYQYSEELEALGSTPSDEDVLKLAAKVEAEQNPYSYNPENWYREKLYNEYIERNYSNGISVPEISGIKKVNDYTCTVLFNSRNVNAISQINIPIVSAEKYLSQYMKGKAEEIKQTDEMPLGCGPYRYSEISDGEAELSANEYCFNGAPDFGALEFVDLSKEKKSASELVLSGKIDVATTLATQSIINSFGEKPVEYFINHNDEYTSLFFNSSRLTQQQRRALMGLCSLNGSVENEIGSYFTGLKRPLSVRFEEYPHHITEPYYKESAYTAFTIVNTETLPSELTAYYCGDELEKIWLEEYKNILSSKGVKLNIVSVSEEELASGKADLWIASVADGATSDKYDWFNTNGKLNTVNISNPEIDALTQQIRSALGLSDKTALTEKVLDLVMEQAVECPLYQRQRVTVYNTEKISEESFSSDFDYDGFSYSVAVLKKK